MAENTVFYLSNDPNNGISLPIKGTLTSDQYLNAGKEITTDNLVKVEIGTDITGIGLFAFADFIALESVTFNETSKVVIIGDYAFESCSKLQNLTIPDSVTSIGIQAFYNCQSLESVTLPTNVNFTTISKSTFYNSKLESITIPDSVTSIGNGAFSSCNKLQSVTIGDRVKSIGMSAFSSCNKLQSLTIPNSVESIGSDAFKDCGIANVKMSEESAISLSLTSNIKQSFFGQQSVFIQCPNTFVQSGIISGIGTRFDAMELGQIVLRYYKPSLRTFEQSRDGFLIVDLSMLFASDFDTSIQEIKWLKKNNDNDEYTEQTAYRNGRTYHPYIKGDIIKVECKYRQKAGPGDNDSTFEFTAVSNPTIPDQTIVDNYFEFETLDLDSLSDIFDNAEFRKTITKVFFSKDITAISNTGLFQDGSFLYENMQEVEVPKTVTSITGTPFPQNTRYYIRSIKKYKNPNTYPWVNDTNKQLYFYLNENSNQLAKTRDDDGVELTVVATPFVYNDLGKTAYTAEKFENVDYLYTSSTSYSKEAWSEILTNRYEGNKYKHVITIPDYTVEDESGNAVYLDKSWARTCVTKNDKTGEEVMQEFNPTSTTSLEYIAEGRSLRSKVVNIRNALYFKEGVVKQGSKETIFNDEYLRIFDIILDKDGENKKVKICIASTTWNDGSYRCDCFPGNSKLILKDGTKKIFHEIEVGDEIQVCSRDMELSYSKVIFLPHLQNNESAKYIKFTTTSNQTIRATDLHLLPVLDKNNTLQNVIAKKITKEDKLYVLNNGKGVPEEIKTIETIQEKGVYTCLVKEGEYIVVDNIVASPFPGDGLDVSYVSKYAFSYTTLRLIANGFSLLDSMGILKYAAPLLRFMVFLVADNCHF